MIIDGMKRRGLLLTNLVRHSDIFGGRTFSVAPSDALDSRHARVDEGLQLTMH